MVAENLSCQQESISRQHHRVGVWACSALSDWKGSRFAGRGRLWRGMPSRLRGVCATVELSTTRILTLVYEKRTLAFASTTTDLTFKIAWL